MRFIITGREPLLYKDLPLLLKELKQGDIFTSLATNGTCLNFVNYLSLVDKIQVSIDPLFTGVTTC